MKHVTYRVPDDFSERLKRYAEFRQISLNRAIDDAMNEAILRVGLDSPYRATPDAAAQEFSDDIAKEFINQELGHHGPRTRDRK